LIKRGKLQGSTKVFSDELFGKEFNTTLNPYVELITVDHLVNHMVGAWPTTSRASDPMFNRPGLSHKILI
jgi:hypothetical protein